MSATVLIWIWLTPLLALPFSGSKGKWLLVAAPLPAFVIALLATFSPVPTGASLKIPWLLVGVVWALDDTARIFLLVSSVLWLAAALYSLDKLGEELYTRRYRVFFLLSMSGNLGLIIAQDMVSFYMGFSLMSLCAYGMVKPARSHMAHYAGRLYLTMAIMGEVALFTSIILLTAQTGGAGFRTLQGFPLPPAAVILIMIGFGIKLGLPGLHVWLPLTYFAAPAATVAVLSSAMINAGILGLLRFLPPGNESLIDWGEILVVIGMIGVFYGIVIGLLQNNARTVLAYSSISKMGTLTVGIGLALNSPQAAPYLTLAIVLYASHHALVKSALFLGSDLISQVKSLWTFLSLCFLALALAGAPLTSGAAVKILLKEAIPSAWHSLAQWLSIAGLATVLLMGRFLFLIWSKHGKRDGSYSSYMLAIAAYASLLIIVAVMPVIIFPSLKLLSGALPVALGAIVIAVLWLRPPRVLRQLRFDIPPGDVLAVMSWLYSHGKKNWLRLANRTEYILDRSARSVARAFESLKQYSSASIETMLHYWELTGALWLVVCLGLIVALI